MSEKYFSGIYIIPSVSVGVFFTALYSLFMRIELYLKETKFTMFASLVAAVLNLILNYIFIPIYGMYAAGYTTLFCYIVLALGHYLILRKLKYNVIYDNKFLLFISILIMLLSIFISTIYKYNIIRYIIILIIIIIALVKRNNIIKIIKNK